MHVPWVVITPCIDYITVSLDTISSPLMCGEEEIGNREATVTRQEAMHDCSIIKLKSDIYGSLKHKIYISLYICNTNHLLT